MDVKWVVVLSKKCVKTVNSALSDTQPARVQTLWRKTVRTNLAEFQTGISQHHQEWMGPRQRGCRAGRWSQVVAFHWCSHHQSCSNTGSRLSWWNNDDAMTSHSHPASVTNRPSHSPAEQDKINRQYQLTQSVIYNKILFNTKCSAVPLWQLHVCLKLINLSL